MKKLSEFTDREIALLLGVLHDGAPGKRSLLISEAAYRLVRSDGGALTPEEEKAIDPLHTYDFRLREAERHQRRVKRRKQRPRGTGQLVVMSHAL